MKTRLALVSCSIGLALAGAIHFEAATGTAPPASKANQAVNAVPVLVELFTAEGCSSCPPADVLLEKILEVQPTPQAMLVGLGEHVDYWNQLGWKDRFSSSLFTRRQQQYATRPASDVYTPQMVVDGREAFVGSDLAAARRAIERAASVAHGVIHLTLDPQASDKSKIVVVVEVNNLPALPADDPAELLLASTEDHLRTEVKHGENQGRTLTHAAVVREMVTLAPMSAGGGSERGTLRIDSDWKRENVKIVAFLQQRRTRHIIGTAVLPLG